MTLVSSRRPNLLPKPPLQTLVATLFCLLSLAIPAQAEEGGKIDQLIEAVGLDIYVASMEDGFREDLPQTIADATGLSTASVLPLAREAFPEGVVAVFIQTALTDALDDAALDRLLFFYKDGLGARATEVENAAQDPARKEENEKLKADYLASLDSSAERRFELAQSLLDSTGAIDNNLAISNNMTYAMIVAGMAAGQTPGVISQEQVLALIAAQEPELRSYYTRYLIDETLFMYRSFSDQELSDYTLFISRPEVRKLYVVVQQAVETYLVEGSRRLGVLLAEAAEKQEL